MGFSENLCMLMSDNNLSSYKLSKEIGVHMTTIANWKSGTQPSTGHLVKLSKRFGVTLDELLSEQKGS